MSALLDNAIVVLQALPQDAQEAVARSILSFAAELDAAHISFDE